MAAQVETFAEEISDLSGDSRCVVENSPHLEALKAKGYRNKR